MTVKQSFICASSLSLVLAVFAASTQPARLPPAWLVLPFGLLFAIVSMVVAGLVSRRKGNLTASSLRAGALVAALPVLLLVLQSLGQLAVADGLIILVLFGVVYFYSYRLGKTVS